MQHDHDNRNGQAEDVMPGSLHELRAGQNNKRAWICYDLTSGSPLTCENVFGHPLLPRLGDPHPSCPGMILCDLRAVPTMYNYFRAFIITGSYSRRGQADEPPAVRLGQGEYERVWPYEFDRGDARRADTMASAVWFVVGAATIAIIFWCMGG